MIKLKVTPFNQIKMLFITIVIIACYILMYFYVNSIIEIGGFFIYIYLFIMALIAMPVFYIHFNYLQYNNVLEKA